MSDEKTLQSLLDFNMKNLAKLYELLLGKPELIEFGSSSIGSSFAECCSEIREHMKRRHGIYQKGEAFNAAWAAMGDPSGVFYFGGFAYNSDTGERIEIDCRTHIQAIAGDLHSIPLPTLRKFDELCKAFLFIERAVRDGNSKPLKFNDRHN